MSLIRCSKYSAVPVLVSERSSCEPHGNTVRLFSAAIAVGSVITQQFSARAQMGTR